MYFPVFVVILLRCDVLITEDIGTNISLLTP
jgi:hypothetical protein